MSHDDPQGFSQGENEREGREGEATRLVRMFQSGDHEAVGGLFRLFHKDVYRILYGMLGFDSDVDDLTQEVFLHVLRSLHAFRFESRFSTWLYRIAVNQALMELRRRRSRPPHMVEDVLLTMADDHEHTIDRQAEYAVFRSRSAQILSTMDSRKRTVFVLFEFAGLELKQLAELLDIPVETVKSRLHWARREFHEQYLAQYGRERMYDAPDGKEPSDE